MPESVSDQDFQLVRQTVAIRSGGEEQGLVIRRSHYVRIQQRIRTEVRGNAASSVWVALTLTSFGIAASLFVTLYSAELPAVTKGKFQVAAWAAVVVMVLCLAAHFATSKQRRCMGDDICAEMDTYVQHGHDVTM